jgi:hypothetical protein
VFVVMMFAGLLVAALPAGAKGATGATVSGGGLSAPVTIKGYGEPDSPSGLAGLADAAGFFPLVFGQQPKITLDSSPTKALGPHYVVAWDMGNSVVREELYPYASGGPLAHVAAGQSVFGGNDRTTGGWYHAGDLIGALRKVGVAAPSRPAVVEPRPTPTAAPRSVPVQADTAWPVWATIAVVLAASILAAGGWLFLRRSHAPRVAA